MRFTSHELRSLLFLCVLSLSVGSFRATAQGTAFTYQAHLTGIGGLATNGNQVTVTDVNAVEPQKFYRIRISLP